MPVDRSQLVIPQSSLAEKRRLLRFSLVSALMHGVVLATLLTWTSGVRLSPPVQVIAIDVSDMALTQRQAPSPALPAGPRPDSAKLPVSAPRPVSVKPLPAAASITPAPDISPPSLLPAPSAGRSSPQAATIEVGVQGIPLSPPVAVHQEDTSRIEADLKPADVMSATTGSYLSRCRALIEKNKDYPVMARRGRIEGTVTVSCVLMRDGSLRASGVARTSGSTLLDNAALRAVRSVGRFPPLPPGIHVNELAFDVPITFRLTTDNLVRGES